MEKMNRLFMFMAIVSAMALCSCSSDDGDTHIDITLNEQTFPDPVFRNYIANLTGTPVGEQLSEDAIAAVTKIDVSGTYDNPGQITSLKGIEIFHALKELYCHYNQLTSLDVSKNTALTELSCSSNQLTSLDVSKNTALTGLYCQYNQLTSLDVSKNTALTDLYCHSNQLTSLDISKNTALTYLDGSQDFEVTRQQLAGGKYGILLENATEIGRINNLTRDGSNVEPEIETLDGHKYLVVLQNTQSISYKYDTGRGAMDVSIIIK